MEYRGRLAVQKMTRTRFDYANAICSCKVNERAPIFFLHSSSCSACCFTPTLHFCVVKESVRMLISKLDVGMSPLVLGWNEWSTLFLCEGSWVWNSTSMPFCIIEQQVLFSNLDLFVALHRWWQGCDIINWSVKNGHLLNFKVCSTNACAHWYGVCHSGMQCASFVLMIRHTEHSDATQAKHWRCRVRRVAWPMRPASSGAPLRPPSTVPGHGWTGGWMWAWDNKGFHLKQRTKLVCTLYSISYLAFSLLCQ